MFMNGVRKLFYKLCQIFFFPQAMQRSQTLFCWLLVGFLNSFSVSTFCYLVTFFKVLKDKKIFVATPAPAKKGAK